MLEQVTINGIQAGQIWAALINAQGRGSTVPQPISEKAVPSVQSSVSSSFSHSTEIGYGIIVLFTQQRSLAITISNEDAGLKAEFEEQVKQWKSETAHWSSVTRMIAHPSYLRIIGLANKATKREVTKLLLQEMSNEPDHWFAALTAITRCDPTRAEDDLDEATNAWLEWGRQEGIL
jgi:hypothetical protein